MSLRSELYDIRMGALLGTDWKQKLDSAYNEIVNLLKIKALEPEESGVIFCEGFLPDSLKHVAVWSTNAKFRDLIVEKLVSEGVDAKENDQPGNSFCGFTVDFRPLTT